MIGAQRSISLSSVAWAASGVALSCDIGAVVIGDVRLPMQVQAALQARFDYEEARLQTLPMKFACPSVVLREGGTNSGATEIFQPWGDAVAEG